MERGKEMEKPIIGIIGIKGRYGRWFQSFFSRLGYIVIGSDVETEMTNRQVVEGAGVVVFCVPLRTAASVIRALTPYSSEKQLWMDITSTKVFTMEMMQKSKAEFVGVHPKCAPTIETLKGQALIVCIGRLESWKEWLYEVLPLTGATVMEEPIHTHDWNSALHCAPHVANLAIAEAICALGFDLRGIREKATPFFRLTLSLIGRMLSQGGELYTDIQLRNPYSLCVIRVLESKIRQIKIMIQRKNRKGLLAEFERIGKFFGKNNISEEENLFNEFMKLGAELMQSDVIILLAKDRKGLLTEILEVFSGLGVNLTFIHSSKQMEMGNVKFFIACEQPKSSIAVKEALEKIKKVPDVEVLK